MHTDEQKRAETSAKGLRIGHFKTGRPWQRQGWKVRFLRRSVGQFCREFGAVARSAQSNNCLRVGLAARHRHQSAQLLAPIADDHQLSEVPWLSMSGLTEASPSDQQARRPRFAACHDSKSLIGLQALARRLG